MAPIMWLPLLILITLLLSVVKSIIYFTKDKGAPGADPKSTYLNTNWLW